MRGLAWMSNEKEARERNWGGGNDLFLVKIKGSYFISFVMHISPKTKEAVKVETVHTVTSGKGK